jgi:membrane protease YdiL (CAAX protease family)
VAFLTPPILIVAAIWLDVALGGVMPGFLAAEKIPLAIANFGLVLVLGGPMGEEFGWRGYLTPALTARMNWRAASLVVGVIWGIWHLPLFFTAGTPQAAMAMSVFILNILAGAVIFGWMFERTRGSVVPALVLHTSLNAWAGILAIIPTATVWRPYVLLTGLQLLVAVALLLAPSRKPVPTA